MKERTRTNKASINQSINQSIHHHSVLFIHTSAITAARVHRAAVLIMPMARHCLPVCRAHPPLTHYITHSLTISLTHSLYHYITHSLTISLTISPTHYITHALTDDLEQQVEEGILVDLAVLELVVGPLHLDGGLVDGAVGWQTGQDDLQ